MASGSNNEPIPPKIALALRNDCIMNQRTNFRVKRNYDFNRNLTASRIGGSIILNCHCDSLYSNARQELKTMGGIYLYEISTPWWSAGRYKRLEPPGGGKPVMKALLRWGWGHFRLDCSFTNTSDEGVGREERLEVRGIDDNHSIIFVMHEKRDIAILRRKAKSRDEATGASRGFEHEYEIDVAQGIDIMLISIVAIMVADYVQTIWQPTIMRIS